MKYYCLSCSKETDYTFSKPKFCSHCGTSTAAAVASIPIGKPPQTFTPTPTQQAAPFYQPQSPQLQQPQIVTKYVVASEPIPTIDNIHKWAQSFSRDVEVTSTPNESIEKFGAVVGTEKHGINRRPASKRKISNKILADEWRAENTKRVIEVGESPNE